MRGAVRSIGLLLKGGGVTSHVIDLRDHRFGDADPLHFLRYSDREWLFLTRYRSAFSNRLRLRDYVRELRKAGFKAIKVRKMKNCGEDYLRRISEKMHPQFKRYPPEELRALVVHIVAEAK